VLVQMSKDDEDWRVKGVCAFTRSIGDCQMKDKTAASLYNSYSSTKVTPRPGVKPKTTSKAGGRNRTATLSHIPLAEESVQELDEEAAVDEVTKPYIINGAEFRRHEGLKDGFVIIGCDGVWDEMSSEEAVKIVGELIRKHAHDEDANLADLFIERVLVKAVIRLQDTDPDETDLTIEELKARPQGKRDPSHRSCLHDDITVVILHYQTDLATQLSSKVTLTQSYDAVEMAKQLFDQVDANGDGLLDAAEISSLATRLGRKLSEAELAEAMAEMDGDGDGSVNMEEWTAWWTARGFGSWDGVVAVELFTEVDENGDGQLDSTELSKLMKRLGKAMSTSELEEAMREMDTNGDGTISCDEFEAWWQDSGTKLVRAAKSSKLRTGDGGVLDNLLANVQLLSQDEARRQSTEQIVELANSMDQKSVDQIEQLFDTLDTDQNGA
jgi:Ca2+-binding EF-hand superfamily protein/serine/threonine protein phosphatase PrpC